MTQRWALAALLACALTPTAAIAEWSMSEAGQLGVLPYFPAASNPHWEGFARIINDTPQAGSVRIEGIDDAGTSYGPFELEIEARAVRHFNSGALEERLGDGTGDWRLHIASNTLDIEVLAYVRTSDGFVTAMHQVAVTSDEGMRHDVPFFNPGSNHSQVSRLRIVNPGEKSVAVSVEGRDDAADAAENAVTFTIAPGAARTVTAQALESGEGLALALGDGQGKWRLTVTAESPVYVMSLLRSPTGHLSNLSAPGLLGGEPTVTLPYFPAASNPHWEGFVRIINDTPQAGSVRIEGIDDAGTSYGPFELEIEARAVRHFNSGALEERLGDGTGDWRLHIASNTLDIEVLAYVRTSDGFVTAMHQVAVTSDEGMRHDVPFFNPGSNHSQVSRLRIVNPGEDPVTALIVGLDDAGEATEGFSFLHLAPGAARTVTAQVLESGEGLALALGDGQGKWRLTVTAESPVYVMSLLRSPTGHLSNLSAPGLRVPALSRCDKAGDDIVDIPDTQLRTMVQRELGKEPGEPIRASELASLTGFYRTFRPHGIERLTGLECATSLLGLRLWDTQVTDLAPLSGLNWLLGLGLYGSKVSDLTPLSGLRRLTELTIRSSPVTDLIPLARLVELTRLDLSKTQVTDLTPLSGLSGLASGLEELDVSGTPVSDLAPLFVLRWLTKLNLKSTRVTDLTSRYFSGGLPSGLTDLNLSATAVRDLTPLFGLTELTRLNLENTQVTDISPLVSNLGLGAGDTINLSGAPLSDESRNVYVPALRARGVLVLL